jgi:exo-beta-1,3-glucanase (GH17 family)
MSRGYRDAFPVDSRSSAHGAGRPGYFTSPPTGFPGADFASMSWAQRIALLHDILAQRIHGLSFSPYLDGQSPGLEIAEEQIRARLAIIQPYTRWIRTFSCTEGSQATPRIAHELGLKTMVGIDLGPDQAENEEELLGGIAVASTGHADILAVGNEVLLRGDLSEDELLACIARVREAVPGTTIGYVDAYFLFEKHPRLVEACDVLLINCYPFWEYCPFEYSLHHMQEMYRRTERIAGGKPIVISETGWPSHGTPYGAALPGRDEALNYFLNTYLWAEEDGIEIVYFAAFDESWKTGDEGDVGAYWGLWDASGRLKYAE